MKKMIFSILTIFLTLSLFGEIRSYLPHIVMGGGYTTKIVVLNLSDRDAKVILQFYNEDGENWYVNGDGGSSFRFNLDIDSMGKYVFTVNSDSESVENGWCLVTSTEECYFSEVIYYELNGDFIDSTGFVPLPAKQISYLPVSINSLLNQQVGVSILNPFDISQSCYLELYGEGGNLIDSNTVNIKPHSKFIQFINTDIFMNMTDNFKGYLKVKCNYGVSVLGIEIRDLSMSFLNSLVDEKPLRNENTIFVDSTYGSDFLGDGTVLKPYKTIKKALTKCTSGNLIYLFPGIYSEDTGEDFPIVAPFCCEIMGSGIDRTFIIGGGNLSRKNYNVCIKGMEKSFISNLTISNPMGAGIYSDSGFVVFNCKITSCGAEGLLVSGSGFFMYGSVVTGNAIGVRVMADSNPDFGGGCRYCPGGNYFYGNSNCDFIFEGSGVLPARFNFWDSEVPVKGNNCESGVDIVETGSGYVRY